MAGDAPFLRLVRDDEPAPPAPLVSTVPDFQNPEVCRLYGVDSYEGLCRYISRIVSKAVKPLEGLPGTRTNLRRIENAIRVGLKDGGLPGVTCDLQPDGTILFGHKCPEGATIQTPPSLPVRVEMTRDDDED